MILTEDEMLEYHLIQNCQGELRIRNSHLQYSHGRGCWNKEGLRMVRTDFRGWLQEKQGLSQENLYFFMLVLLIRHKLYYLTWVKCQGSYHIWIRSTLRILGFHPSLQILNYISLHRYSFHCWMKGRLWSSLRHQRYESFNLSNYKLWTTFVLNSKAVEY